MREVSIQMYRLFALLNAKNIPEHRIGKEWIADKIRRDKWMIASRSLANECSGLVF